MKIQAIKTKVFKEGENLYEFIVKYILELTEKSIVVITSKIVALSENRVRRIRTKIEKVNLIASESSSMIKTKWCYLAEHDGLWCANAGIDESNVEGGGVILLPQDCWLTAAKLSDQLKRFYKIKRLGVLITDSHSFPLRSGVVGIALGYAGFKGLRSYVGKSDLFGREFKFSKTNIADSLAAAAVVLMGEGCERQPLVLIKEAPVQFSTRVNRSELKIDPVDDMYQPLFAHIEALRRRKL